MSMWPLARMISSSTAIRSPVTLNLRDASHSANSCFPSLIPSLLS